MWMFPDGGAGADVEEASPEAVAESLVPDDAWSSLFTSFRLELGVDELVSLFAEEESAIVISEVED